MNKELQIKFIETHCPFEYGRCSIRRVRKTFFKNIETEIQAYLLGFYAADGSINEKRKTLRIHLKSDDAEIVYLYKDFICPDARTFIVQPHKTTGRGGRIVQAHQSFGIDINNVEICNSLVDLGFGYAKSYSDLHLPNIKHSLLRHFIRGYFDGDGSVSGFVPKEKNRKPRFRKQFEIVAKSKSILEDIKQFFEKYTIKINLNYCKRDDMYKLSTSSMVEFNKIYDLLYSNSNYYLSRKFNKMYHYVNTEVTQLIAEYCNAQEVNVSESNNLPKSSEQDLIDYYENNYFEF